MDGYAAVILAGGTARRLDGADKPAIRLAGQPLLARVLRAVTDADVRVVVGPSRAVPDGVLTTRERPSGGGPVAAVAAGLTLVPAHLRYVALLAADLPFLTNQAVRDLRAAATVHDAAPTGHGDTAVPGGYHGAGSPTLPEAAVYTDGDGRWQFLCAVWRTGPLRRRLATLGRTDGVPLKRLYTGAWIAELTSGAHPPPWYDCDTAEELRRAETWL